MTAAGSRPRQRHPDPSLSGPEWAAWLRQACPRPVSYGSQAPGLSLDRAWDALVYLARRKGFAVDRGDCRGGEAITTWHGRRITVHGDMTAGRAVMALAHQLAHMYLHADIAQLEADGIVPCQGIRRVEADSVAYLVADRLGIDTPAIGFPRVSSWAGTDPRAQPGAAVQAVSGRILGVAYLITSHLAAERGAASDAAARDLVPGTAIDQPERRPAAPRSDLVRIHEAAAQFFRDQLADSWASGYLNGRGFGPAVQQQWQAGYAPAQWAALTTNLQAAGYPDTLIEAAGLARRSRRGTLIDTFRDRAMLPIHAVDGTIVAFIGRAAPGCAAEVPKYLNSPHTDLYDKSSVLFGLWHGRATLAEGARPVITEGPFDAIAVTSANPSRYAGLAPCGTALTASQLASLDRVVSLRARGVLVAFDPDEAGQRAAVKAYHLLSPLTDRAEAVIFPAAQDPAQILSDRGGAALAETLADRVQPLADEVIEAEVARWDRWLMYPSGQVNALRAAAPHVAALSPDQVGRQVARLAQRLGLDHATVTEAVTDALTELIADGRYQRPNDPGTPGAHTKASAPRSAASERRPGSTRERRATGRDFPHPTRPVTARAATTAPPRGPRRATGPGRGGQRPSAYRASWLSNPRSGTW